MGFCGTKQAPPRGAFSWLPGGGLAILLLLGGAGIALAEEGRMSEVLYQEKEADQSTYQNRILILGSRLRMDFGSDAEDYILFDRKAGMAWHVARESRRMVGIASYAPQYAWPKAWALEVEHFPAGDGNLTQVRLNAKLCAEFKSSARFREEAALLRDFRRALAGNHSTTWTATPEAYRHPCELAMDVREAGIEYRDGLPLAVRYWDGRSRVFQGQKSLPARPELFELPADFERLVIAAPQLKPAAKQPRSSQRK